MSTGIREGSPLGVRIAGFSMANPTMLASGILGTSAELLRRVVEAGAGAVVTKSIGLLAREGYRNPTVVDVGCGLLNAIGLSNPGMDAFKKELSSLDRDFPVVVSIFGKDEDEFSSLASQLKNTCAKAVELNLSCPHVEKVGLELGHDADAVADVVKATKKMLKIPVFAKLSPSVADPASIALSAEKAGADAITATNTIRAMAIDVETFRPILSNRFGGLSGPALKPIALRCVYEISECVKVPVLGCGGVRTWQDAVEYMLAGASAVQIGSALINQDLHIFRRVVVGLRRYIAEKGFRTVRDIVGLSHKV